MKALLPEGQEMGKGWKLLWNAEQAPGKSQEEQVAA
jgi:hypothetical protein